MKNIQVIDGANNCAYSIFQISDENFLRIFTQAEQDIEFISDFIEREGEEEVGRIVNTMWDKRVDKTSISGIHGTLFYELDYKKKYYPNKREADLDASRGR